MSAELKILRIPHQVSESNETALTRLNTSIAGHHPATGLLGTIKHWFKARNKEQKYLRLRAFWRTARNFYYCHSTAQFVSYLIVQTKTKFGNWSELNLPSWLIQSRFHVRLVNFSSGKYIIKLPRGNTAHSCELLHRLRIPEELARYQNTLTTLREDMWLRNHTVRAWDVKSNGGYSCEFVEGINLAKYRSEFLTSEPLSKQQRIDLLNAIANLVKNLRGYYQENKKLIGDWQLHNMVYSHHTKTIINVDAEGFFSYDDKRFEAHLPFIESNLGSLADILTLLDCSDDEAHRILDVFRAVDEVRKSDKQYNACVFVAGYHSLELGGHKFRGQRECAERLARVPYDFTNKRVLDIGCNVGGMLHAISGQIKAGYGIDFNPDCINAAQLIKTFNSSPLEFYTFDLDRQDLSLLSSFLHGEKVDICFVLSVCRWLERWIEVIHAAASISEAILFETNGSIEQQNEQIELLERYFKNIELISESSQDDYTVADRSLYLCTLPIHSNIAADTELLCAPALQLSGKGS